MAGNNSIQFLRGSGHNSSEALLPGQPYYDYTNNLLFIGGSTNTPINTANPVGNSIRKYWENVGSNGTVNAKLGDRAFIETTNGHILPALCVDSDYTNGTTWQVSWYEKHRIAASSTTTWGGTELYTWLNNEVLNLLPDYLKNKITGVTKSSGGDDPGTSCKLWVPSAEEIWEQAASFPTYMSKDSNSTQLVYYKWLLEGGDVNTAILSNYKLQSNSYSWLRNGVTTGTAFWTCLDGGGRANSGAVNNEYSILFCFSIK